MIDLNQFENPQKNIYVLKKWDWNYLEAEAFQLACVDFVNSNPHISLFIFCSHSNCFTIGRGLQKLKENTGVNLVDFDENSHLAFPLHQIKRGGGLTFHYPGQFVFYPIIYLTYHKLAVHDFMTKILEVAISVLEEQFKIKNLVIRHDLLGLWFENIFKIASMGLAISRFNTYHGMALNFFQDQNMFQALQDLYPCGLSGKTYLSLESIISQKLSANDREIFFNNFLNTIVEKYSKRTMLVPLHNLNSDNYSSLS